MCKEATVMYVIRILLFEVNSTLKSFNTELVHLLLVTQNAPVEIHDTLNEEDIRQFHQGTIAIIVFWLIFAGITLKCDKKKET